MEKIKSMNNPSDQEIDITYRQMSSKFKELVSHQTLFSRVIDLIKPEDKKVFKFRNYLFYKLLNGWNEERMNNGYSKLTAKRLATALNSNPFLKDSTEELYTLIKKCEDARNYKYVQWILFPKKK